MTLITSEPLGVERNWPLRSHQLRCICWADACKPYHHHARP